MAQRRVSPVLVLALVSALPAIALGGLWRFANARAEDATLVIESVDDDSPLGALPATPVLSMRRAPDVVSHDVNAERLAAELAAVQAMTPPGSCLTVAIDDEIVVNLNGDGAVIPASNVKLATAAVALQILGPDHRYITEARAEIGADGVVDGDLYLVGGGDPLLAAAWYPESGLSPYPPTPVTRIEDLVEGIAAAGVTEVRGKVIGDGTRYDDEFYAPTWGDDVRGIEAGPLDALMVNDSMVEGERRKSQDPAEGAARELTRLLRERGISVRGRAGVGQVPGEMAVIAEVQSAPMSEIVAEMLATSDDNTAEMVLKEIGFMTSGSGARDSGLTVVAATLTGMGAPTGGLVLVDGSGLSVENRMSCSLLQALLARHTPTDALGAGLAVLGASGTLNGTATTHPLAGRLRAKTGTLTDVKALSGFVPADDGSAVRFALVLNGQVEGLSVSDPGVFEPIWTALFDALATYPSGPSSAEVAPLTSG